MHRVEFTINDPLEQVEAEVHRLCPDLLAVSCYIWNITSVLELADNLKKVLPGVRILLGGPEVSFDAPAILAANPAVDLIITGEGERPWSVLLDTLPDGSLADVPGLCWRERGAVRLNAAPLPLGPGEWPAPYVGDLADLGGRLAYYESSRGCPFACSFCLSGREDVVRFADPARVLEEIDRLAGSGAITVKFVDRTFNCRPEHSMAIWRGLLQYRGRMRFHFEIVGELLTGDELSFLATVPPGLFQFEVGIQSTNPATLAALGRRGETERLMANLRVLLGVGNIHVYLDFIAGLPFEGYERFLSSLDSGLRLAPDTIQLGFLKLLHGSRLREEALSLGYRWRAHPPYEVLSNPWLAFVEIRRLKVMADLIDRYYNERRFAATLPRLFARASSPARFFEGFAAFTEERGEHLRATRVQDLPARLLAFAASRGWSDAVLRDCLRYDLHRLGRGEGEPPWADPPVTLDLQARWREWLGSSAHRAALGMEFEALGPRDVLRRTRLLAFRHDPTAGADEPAPRPAVVVMIYPERTARERVRAVKLPGGDFGLA